MKNSEEKLRSAISNFTKAIESSGKEDKVQIGSAYYGRGFAQAQLNNFVEALSDFEEAEVNGFENEEYSFQFGLILSELNKYKLAINKFENSIDLGKEENKVLPLIIMAHLGDGETELGLDRINNYLKGESDLSFENIDIYLAKINILLTDFKTSEAEIILSKISSEWPKEPKIILESARFKLKVGEFDIAILLLENKDKIRFNELDELRIVLLSESYSRRGKDEDYVKLNQLLKSRIDTKRPDDILKMYAESLRKLGKLSDCLSICKKVKEHNGLQIFFQQLAIDIYYNELRDFTKAANLLKELIKIKPNDTQLILNYASCLHLIGKHHEAIDAIRQVEEKNIDRKRDILFISSAYEHVGKYEKSLELALEGLNLNYEDPNAHMFYFNLFLRSENFIEKMEPKHIKAFQKIQNTFNTLFPGNKSLTKIKVPSDPEELKAFMIKQFKERQGNIEEIESMYTKLRLPTAFLAKATGKNIFSISLDLLFNQDLKVWISSGLPNEIESETKTIKDANTILIDATTLVFLNYFKLLDHVTNSFDEIYIPHVISSSLEQQLLFEKMASEKGYLSVAYKAGRLVSQEVNSASIKKRIDFFQKIGKWLTSHSNVSVIGKDVSRIEQSTDKKYHMIKDTLGEEVMDTLIESHLRNIPAFCVDVGLRQILVNDFRTKSFGFIPYLELLLQQQKIDEDEYYDIKIELINFGCHFVSVNANVLKYCLKKYNYQSNPILQRLFSSLSHPDNDISLLPNIAISFLIWLWNTSSGSTKDKWTDIMLWAIIKNREGIQSRLIHDIEINVTRNIDGTKRKSFQKSLSQWKKSNNIIEII